MYFTCKWILTYFKLHDPTFVKLNCWLSVIRCYVKFRDFILNANTGTLIEWVPRCFGLLPGLVVVVVEQVTLWAQWISPTMGQRLLAQWSGIEQRGKSQSQLDLKDFPKVSSMTHVPSNWRALMLNSNWLCGFKVFIFLILLSNIFPSCT